LRFDLTSISALQEAFEERIQQARQMWEMGVPLEEVNRRLELGIDIDAVPGAEVSWVATGVSPAGGTEADASVDVITQIANLVHRGAMSREAAAKILARKVDWMSEQDALDLLVQSDGVEGVEGML